MLNIFDFAGADDDARLAAAIAYALGRPTGEVIHLPAGNYLFRNNHQFAPSGTFKAVDLQGDGRGQTKVTLEGVNSRFRWGGTNMDGSTFGAMGGETGGFTIQGGTVNPKVAIEVAGGAGRAFENISIYEAEIGFYINSHQNAYVANLLAQDCSNVGVLFDRGAGGNTVIHPSLQDNACNVRLQQSTGVNLPKVTPSDNRVISGLIESQHGGTLVHVDHLVGQNNYWSDVQFGGGPSIVGFKITHNGGTGPAGGPTAPTASHHLHLNNCYMTGGARAFDHIADNCIVHVRQTHFRTMPLVAALGLRAKIRMDAWDLVDVAQRTQKIGTYTGDPDVTVYSAVPAP